MDDNQNVNTETGEVVVDEKTSDFDWDLTFNDLAVVRESELGNLLGKFLYEIFSPKNASKVVVTANLGKYKFDLKVQY